MAVEMQESGVGGGGGKRRMRRGWKWRRRGWKMRRRRRGSRLSVPSPAVLLFFIVQLRDINKCV